MGFVTNRKKNCYESVTDSCEQFTDGYVLLRAVYDTYGLLRVIYGNINPCTIVRRFFTCQKICLSFHGSVTVSSKLLPVVRSYLRIPASYYGCLRLTTTWRSVRTRKKNPSM